ncbi:hypothetical protein N657DRAFT_654306 [Parathielavia appendiculata]|uniref:Rab-GAP TBC domain-containing protein n=1 Tax=Parathielavia appendiculata TaxID=2587402 RepID=A0AAN6Z5W1_9PEZI|nr:hypothetical protein N657DRAFT_654306 [Parathielavia appendiculata]
MLRKPPTSCTAAAMLDNSGSTEDAAGGAGYPAVHYNQQPNMRHGEPGPPQWPGTGPRPKHHDADPADASEQCFQSRPFRAHNHPPGPMRPSSAKSPRPVLQLRSDGHVPPDLVSPRSDSFFYSRPARPCPSPRTRAESAFPGLSSNPFIPESPESETSHPEIRKFPLLPRQHDQLARLSPVSNPESPVDSRQGTPTEPTMVENFSRPRKTSVRSQQSDSALSRSNVMAALRLQAGPPLLDQPPTCNPQQIPSNSTPGPNPWPRTRRFSGSSSQTSSTFSSIPPRPSNDYLNTTPRTDSLRQASSSVIAPLNAVPRPPPTHYNPNGPQTHLREIPPWLASSEETRSSFRSQLTSSTAQGTLFTTNGTERNSVVTKASSITEQSIINGYWRRSWRPNSVDDGPSLEDVMGMYERGFNDSDIESIRRSMRLTEDDNIPEPDADAEEQEMEGSRPASCHSDASGLRAKVLEAMNDSLPIPGAVPIPESGRSTARESRTRQSLLPNSLPKDLGLGLATEPRPKRQSAEQDAMEKHDSAKLLDGDDDFVTLKDNAIAQPSSPTSPTSPTSPISPVQLPSPTIDLPSPSTVTPAPMPRVPQEPPEEPGSRDRYGFRKASANVTRQEYDAWDHTYSEYLARRRRKWIAFLKDNSLMTDRPNRFPPRSAKTKRFIRKGIPPDWRGAAWFYYAGGPAILSKHRGVYDQLVRRAGLDPNGPGRIPNQTGEVKPVIVEDIEKDLYRTFPDNVRFKPPPSPPGAASPQPALSQPAAEPEIITSLRRVLHAFALYNPRIGYCQSLNFLAGLLLLFVETEEQAFWLLNVITRVYLPGTHEMSLEGSKVDLGVLMIALKDSMPGVWKQIGGDELEAGKKSKARRGHKLGHGGNPGSIHDPNRLPAITLCMTAWFMSCFIGTLPIETVLRVWDVFFYEGSRTLFRIALTIFKLGEREIKAVQDPMEMFGVVQTFPRRMLDCNTLMETCYKRRNGIGHLSQQVVEEKRKERRDGIRRWKAEQEAAASNPNSPRPATRHRFGAAALGLDLATDFDEVRRKANLFVRRKDREQERAAEVV